MTFAPTCLRPMRDGRTLAVSDAGRFVACSDDMLDRLVDDALLEAEADLLRSEGHLLAPEDALGAAAHAHSVAQ